MNENDRLIVKLGFACCCTLAATLTGSASPEQQRDGGVYDAPSGQVDTAYVEIRTESDFYEPLSAYGRWEVVGSYGRCWIPNGGDADWRPYSNGYWQQTDAGWYWVSDEPWGWATYHYGRWDSSPQYGWYWVPQTQWAPAWVSWREGGGYVGWTPMGPSGRVVVEVNTRAFVFVEERQFLEPVRHQAAIVNNTVINKTVNITTTRTVNNTVINEGPNITVIEKASGRKLQAVPVRQLRTKEEAKVVRKPAATPATAKAPTTPAPRQTEKVLPASQPQKIEKPAITKAEPQPAAAKNEANQAEMQSREAKLEEQKRAQQEAAKEKVGEQAKPAAKPEAKPEIKPNAKPAAKPEAKPEVKAEPKPEAGQPAANGEPTDQNHGKDNDKKD